MAFACCKTTRLEICIEINTNPTMHKVISALLSSGLSSESLLGPLNSATMELGLRSGSIHIASITMVPGNLKPWFRLVYPNKHDERNSRFDPRQGSTGCHCWRFSMRASLLGRQSKVILEISGSREWKVVLCERDL